MCFFFFFFLKPSTRKRMTLDLLKKDLAVKNAVSVPAPLESCFVSGKLVRISLWEKKWLPEQNQPELEPSFGAISHPGEALLQLWTWMGVQLLRRVMRPKPRENLRVTIRHSLCSWNGWKGPCHRKVPVAICFWCITTAISRDSNYPSVFCSQKCGTVVMLSCRSPFEIVCSLTDWRVPLAQKKNSNKFSFWWFHLQILNFVLMQLCQKYIDFTDRKFWNVSGLVQWTEWLGTWPPLQNSCVETWSSVCWH